MGIADTDTGAAGGAGRMDRTESTGSAGAAEGPGSAGNADRTGSNPRKAAASRSDASAPSHHHLRNNSHTLQLLSGANRMRWLIAARGIICGLIAGVLVVGYRVGIEYGTRFAVSAYAWLKGHPLGLLGWIAAVLSASWIITRLVQWEPSASGSGIPQTEGTLLWGLPLRWGRILIVRYAGGLLCSLFGLSLGREGPSIQIGAAASKAAGSRMSRNAIEENTLITGGAAAGLSAAFSAPLSGMMFALEEVHKSFSPSVLLTAVTASLSSDIVSKYWFGLTPVLDFTHVSQIPVAQYAWLIPLGIVAGLIGALMNRILLGFQTLYSKIPAVVRPMIALAAALPCGLLLPLSLGGGSEAIKFAETAQGTLAILCILLAVRILFTGISYSSGVPGGIFMPILAAGALSGSVFAHAMVSAGVLAPERTAAFTVLAMAGTLTAAVKAPITSILLVVEMSGSLVHMFPVAAVAFVSLLISDALHIRPIYPALLERYMKQHEGTDISAMPVHSGMLEIPIEIGSMAADKRIHAISWPDSTSVITIRRGEQEFVPRHDSMLRAGDAIVVIFSGEDERSVRRSLSEICEMPENGY